MFSVPDSVVVRRPFTLGGAAIPVGASLTKEQVVLIGRGLNALLDNGTLVAVPDPFARRNRPPRPTSLPPGIRDAMLGRLSPVLPLSVKMTPVGLSLSVEVTGGVMPFDVTLYDRQGDVIDSKSGSKRSFAFLVDLGGEFTVTVEDAAGASASDTIVVPSTKERARQRPVRDSGVVAEADVAEADVVEPGEVQQ